MRLVVRTDHRCESLLFLVDRVLYLLLAADGRLGVDWRSINFV